MTNFLNNYINKVGIRFLLKLPFILDINTMYLYYRNTPILICVNVAQYEVIGKTCQ